ncbi:hypothetical protein [Pseudomonas vanderleydeniana]|uniref:Uncharacterized protein n=1 Tax=Pseudomonas vanderleydeniana TaxID=2745495 RepID=A0A9E6PQT3_9PSED|nr:hypothetical protein [Pseudomonas vanderleydeniana]QXI31194.1 hypothetical protein HU752_015215 [Pseudomonas vanderleydeniana]
MRLFLSKTFGGLTRQYYIRQFLFSLLFLAIVIWGVTNSKTGLTLNSSLFILFSIVSCFLYPYARFVYESVVGYVMGNNVFFVNAIFMMVVKIFTMYLCWAFSIFIAPVGLLYLYFHHSRNARV